MAELVIVLITIIVSLFGAIISSYFSASIMRETLQTKNRGSRSACDSCANQLGWLELVPILSYLLQKGRCKHCGKPIDKRIFLAEVLGVLIFGLLGVYFANTVISMQLSLQLFLVVLLFAISAGFMLYLSIFDLFTFSIPSIAVKWFLGLAIVTNIVVLISRMIDPASFEFTNLGTPGNLIAGVVGGLAVYALVYFTNEKGIGAGDMYLAIIIGLLLGWPAGLSAFYAIVFSATGVGLTYAVVKRKFKGLIIPLVPFIAFGFMVALVWGQEIHSFLFIQI